jgi:hypothetical protein
VSIGWPEGIYLALVFIGLGLGLARHGQPKTGVHNIWSDIIATALVCGLLWWGGFFS